MAKHHGAFFRFGENPRDSLYLSCEDTVVRRRQRGKPKRAPMTSYEENMEAYQQLFLDAKKYHAIQQALADRLYNELHQSTK